MGGGEAARRLVRLAIFFSSFLLRGCFFYHGELRTSEGSLLLLRNSSAYFGMSTAPALCAELSSSGDAERAAMLDDEALSAREIFDMGAVTRDMVNV